ncbi:Rhomboid family protein [Jannaschia seosinensis]|uniref:Rhomboid family protein n=1 Tax=Jannaschia seosinensis TaxID=313367 RepID=A0A0M7BA08_9RHOB|nr:rhomboid family intramembrane serine protease [Jannaschia seosinensis]CUH27935.1 Rhomboid family protein [Jannaschia seosinensis]
MAPIDPRNQNPFNTLPPLVVGLAVVIMGIEVLFQLGTLGLIGGREAVGWRLGALQDWSVAEPVWDWMWQTRQLPPAEIARLFAYPLIHGSLLHAGFAAVFVLAFGNAIAPLYPGWRFLAIFFGASFDGALGYLILFETPQPLFGAMPGAYGLIGAFAFLTQRGLTRADPARAFMLLGFLLAIQPVFGILTLQGFGWVPPWGAEIIGAATGYALALVLFPGGMTGLRNRLRQR